MFFFSQLDLAPPKAGPAYEQLNCWLTDPSSFPTKQEYHTVLSPSSGQGLITWIGSSYPSNQVDFNIVWLLIPFIRSED
ncbi:hypothetical protein AVEN_164368-1 [Araneus ventricosus]|uniref:Uncharacterized protein n=1 Tax=Araneus ventricosus TaxID=182803 RepID=A0A4Y2RCC7_ARAVE|nr:hypothetical protein AVEN_164368-1 [Araneus ventricosus]